MNQDAKLYQMQKDLKKSEEVHYRHDQLAEQHFTGTDPRRRQELMDSQLIQEDPYAMSNLPREFMNKPFKREAGYVGYRIGDEKISR